MTIIFDLGGVFVPDSTDLLNKTIADFIGMDKENIADIWEKSLPRLFKGEMTIKELYFSLLSNNKETEKLLKIHINTFKNNYTVDNSMIELLQELNSKFTTACLSNTEIEIAETIDEFGLYKYFHHKFISTEIGMRKPDTEIFHYVIKKLNVKESEIIFVDDKIENIEAAKSIGMNAILFENTVQLKGEIENVKISSI